MLTIDYNNSENEQSYNIKLENSQKIDNNLDQPLICSFSDLLNSNGSKFTDELMKFEMSNEQSYNNSQIQSNFNNYYTEYFQNQTDYYKAWQNEPQQKVENENLLNKNIIQQKSFNQNVQIENNTTNEKQDTQIISTNKRKNKQSEKKNNQKDDTQISKNNILCRTKSQSSKVVIDYQEINSDDSNQQEDWNLKDSDQQMEIPSMIKRNTSKDESLYFSKKKDKKSKNTQMSVNDINQLQNEQKQRRLEKNRESARESRKRKKKYIESLEQKVSFLEQELLKLRSIIQNQKDNELSKKESNKSEIL